MDSRCVDHGLPTLRKTRVVGQQQQIVRLDYEDVQPPSPSLESAILAAFEAELDTCDIVVISDYAKGFVSPVFWRRRIIERAHGAAARSSSIPARSIARLPRMRLPDAELEGVAGAPAPA